ncbi:unnamed protein product [Rotaria sp. Silwood1]|nr:unnamed protein product [Rotaria sp. Silwood1]CAF4576882.1 unnamed protein product [Rotaria sp. Silwood1]
MATALQHRGPDGEGFFISENQTVGFAHRRLSVIDLSAQAAQPFNYLHYTITYNGEIYNYIELRDFLKQKGFVFTTQSDTEVILAAYSFWGNNCVQQFDGMFAFAIYDAQKNEVFIARDAYGEKPFYYYVSKDDNSFHFASEMKALWSIGVEKQVNNLQLLNYITIGYTSNPIDASQTFYSNIKNLPAGHFIVIKNYELKIKNWRIVDNEKQATRNEKPETIVEQFENLLTTSIAKRLRSDVAVGTSLSGGIDSSSIVAIINQLAQKERYKPQAFTASFPNFKNDETNYSKQVAAHLHLQQYFTSPDEFDLVNEFETLMYHQEEPIQSASIFTQYMVYKLAKEKDIIVLLDGQGADEVLGGYKKYANWFLQETLRNNLSVFKKEKALLFANDFLESWNYKNYFAAFLPKFTSQQLQSRAIHQQNINQLINKDFLHQYQNTATLQKPIVKNLQDILNYNTNTFGLNDLLRYADRNAMAHSREVRLPFLNKDLVNFVASLPSSYKIKDGFTKWILRESIKNKLPSEIVWRKGKIGYEPPQKLWMQNMQVQEMIKATRKKLVDFRILNPSILNHIPITAAAHDANNFDWWILCAAQLIA